MDLVLEIGCEELPAGALRPALEWLTSEFEKRLIAGVPFKKSMRWGAENVTFARPVHWIGAALDGKRLGFAFGLVMTSTSTRGHRFHAPAELELPRAADYVSTLRQAHVLVDWQEWRDAVWR